jgi:5-bromo-4-chloroindolyl phosphate hydrolysis protein
MTVGTAFLISYQFSPIVKSWLADGYVNKGQWIILFCACIAVLFHAILTIGERILVNDTIYAGIKISENERLKAAELSKFIAAYIEKHGTQPDREELQDLEKMLMQKYRQFPLNILLGIGIVVASLFGYFKSKHNEYQDSNPIAWKDILCFGSTSMVVAVLILILNGIGLN